MRRTAARVLNRRTICIMVYTRPKLRARTTPTPTSAIFQERETWKGDGTFQACVEAHAWQKRSKHKMVSFKAPPCPRSL